MHQEYGVVLSDHLTLFRSVRRKRAWWSDGEVGVFVRLFGVFRPTREFFTHMETSPLPGCKFFTYARHLWPLRSEGSLTCHTYCDTGNPFIMNISEDPWHSLLMPSVWRWSCHYLFLWLRSSAAGVRTHNLPPVSYTHLTLPTICSV